MKVISLVLIRACRDLGLLFFFLTVDLIFLNCIGLGWKIITNRIKDFPPAGHHSEESFHPPREDRQLRQPSKGRKVSANSERERERLSAEDVPLKVGISAQK